MLETQPLEENGEKPLMELVDSADSEEKATPEAEAGILKADPAVEIEEGNKVSEPAGETDAPRYGRNWSGAGT